MGWTFRHNKRERMHTVVPSNKVGIRKLQFFHFDLKRLHRARPRSEMKPNNMINILMNDPGSLSMVPCMRNVMEKPQPTFS